MASVAISVAIYISLYIILRACGFFSYSVHRTTLYTKDVSIHSIEHDPSHSTNDQSALTEFMEVVFNPMITVEMQSRWPTNPTY